MESMVLCWKCYHGAKVQLDEGYGIVVCKLAREVVKDLRNPPKECVCRPQKQTAVDRFNG